MKSTVAPSDPPPVAEPKIPVVSFFTGAGGLDLGFELEGFETVVALDSNESAVSTFNANHPSRPALVRDLRKLTTRALLALVASRSNGVTPRGLIGGPPCQTFSIGNVKKHRHDHRGALGYHYARLLKALNRAYQLDFFIFENVLGIRKKKHRRQFLKILAELTGAGFEITIQDVDASKFGVPQLRHRLIIAGINRVRFPNGRFTFPTGNVSPPRTVRQAISHLREPTFFVRGLEAKDIPFHPNHWTMMPKSPKFKTPADAETDGRSFRRLAWDAPSRTVAYGNREVHLHPEGHRRLSVLESMLLQGFPETYQLHGTLSDQITQISNAVPPPLAGALARAIKKQLYAPLAAMQRDLMAWFETNQRRFPWRETRDPFHVLVAEKLLQQTAAAPVTDVFERLMLRYPTPAKMAAAPVADVRDIIQPLCLHYRAKELVALACTLVTRHQGTVPKTLEELLALPGVGDYAARAVLSFAHNMPVPIVDTNVARFLVRTLGLKNPRTKNPARHRGLLSVAAKIVPPQQGRTFNLAVLDLAAAHCTATKPGCSQCCLSARCAFAHENPPKSDAAKALAPVMPGRRSQAA